MAVDSCALFDHNGDNGDDLGWNVLRKVADVGILILVNDEVVFDLMGVMTWMMLVLRLKVCLKKWVFCLSQPFPGSSLVPTPLPFVLPY